VEDDHDAPLAASFRLLAPQLLDDAGARRLADEARSLLRAKLASEAVGYEKTAYRPLVFLDPFLYEQRLLAVETRLAVRLFDLASLPKPNMGDKATASALSSVLASPAVYGSGPVELSDEQKKAVLVAARSSFAIVSGGPGTGKTSIVVALVRTLARLGYAPASFVLAAPTGKAAARLGDALRAGLEAIARPDLSDYALRSSKLEASTLHRLLGYSPHTGRFSYDERHPLEAEVVIVDEGSMIDLRLMERLLSALRPGKRLILLGDADQLPSVQAGAVLRDLVQADALADKVVRLTQSYRMNPRDPDGRSVLSIAQRIHAGTTDLISDAAELDLVVCAREKADDLQFRGVEILSPDTSNIDALLDVWFEKRIAASSGVLEADRRVFAHGPGGIAATDRPHVDELLSHLASAKLLTVTRVFSTGADRVNEQMHAKLAESRRSRSSAPFFAGEPVMVVGNDYEQGIFNGDQGVVLWLGDRELGKRLFVVFARPDGHLAVPLAALRDNLALAYATTIHKAQGSEYDHVAVICPEEDLPMFSREVLYTAVTRAKKSVVLWGDDALVRAAIARPMVRSSGLTESLSASSKH
jgi:exodeoxyribonuclease V alpha subunit